MSAAETPVMARDVIAEALTRLRFLSDLSAAWDVEQIEVSADNLAGIGLILDDVIALAERVDRMLEGGVESSG